MNHHSTPLAIGLVALLGTLAGCAQAPVVTAAAPHPMVDFAIDRAAVSRFDDSRFSRFDFRPRFESYVIHMTLRHH